MKKYSHVGKLRRRVNSTHVHDLLLNVEFNDKDEFDYETSNDDERDDEDDSPVPLDEMISPFIENQSIQTTETGELDTESLSIDYYYSPRLASAAQAPPRMGECVIEATNESHPDLDPIISKYAEIKLAGLEATSLLLTCHRNERGLKVPQYLYMGTSEGLVHRYDVGYYLFNVRR